jgi:hypothetical protein
MVSSYYDRCVDMYTCSRMLKTGDTTVTSRNAETGKESSRNRLAVGTTF